MARTYDLKNIVCTVGGIAASGYGETDALTLEWASEIVQRTVTADGVSIFSRLNDRALMVTLTLSQKSRAYTLLAGLMETQHGETIGIAPPQILPMPFMMVDPATGDEVSSAECIFMTRPAPSKGRTVGEVQFQLCLPDPAVSNGLANLI